MTKKWIPLESNPDVLNTYASNIGLDLAGHAFCDVYGLDEEMLSMVPEPVLALIMCFPLTPGTEAAAQKEDESADLSLTPSTGPSGVYFMKQTIGNACGTIALLHVAGNCPPLKAAPGSFLEEFLSSTKAMDPEARGKYLETPPEGSKNIQDAHQAAASEGDTAAPNGDEDVDLHFVAFVHHNGRLLQLDGRRPRPVDHGPTSSLSLLKDTAVVVQQFVETTKSIAFNLMALTASD